MKNGKIFDLILAGQSCVHALLHVIPDSNSQTRQNAAINTFTLAYHSECPLCRYVRHEFFMWLETMFVLLVQSFQDTLFIKHTIGKDNFLKNMRSTRGFVADRYKLCFLFLHLRFQDAPDWLVHN